MTVPACGPARRPPSGAYLERARLHQLAYAGRRALPQETTRYRGSAGDTGPAGPGTLEAMAPRGQVIENPLSGEQIAILRTAADTGGTALEWELVLAPGGRVPSSHAHPEQEEVFTVLAGQLRFRVGLRRIIANPGDTVRIPPGTVHHFANAAAGQPGCPCRPGRP